MAQLFQSFLPGKGFARTSFVRQDVLRAASRSGPHGRQPGSIRLPVADLTFYQLKTPTVLLLMLAFYGGTFLMSTRIARRSENVDGYMNSNGAVGFGISAASMTATWIWAASFYASATSGYKYGISGPIHYGLWGALMILFIYPFGRRFREVAPEAHTLAEIMHARHGRSSQLILAGSNIAGSVISLMANFTAAGALVAMLSPLD